MVQLFGNKTAHSCCVPAEAAVPPVSDLTGEGSRSKHAWLCAGSNDMSKIEWISNNP